MQIRWKKCEKGTDWKQTNGVQQDLISMFLGETKSNVHICIYLLVMDVLSSIMSQPQFQHARKKWVFSSSWRNEIEGCCGVLPAESNGITGFRKHLRDLGRMLDFASSTMATPWLM